MGTTRNGGIRLVVAEPNRTHRGATSLRALPFCPTDENRGIDSCVNTRRPVASAPRAPSLPQILSDPEEGSAHANALMALGLCGQPGAFQAIRAWASAPREGEIDRDTFRAWQALPYALGHVGRRDRRAVARLEALIDAKSPKWTFRHHRGARLRRLARRAAATALAVSGLPEAGEVLDRARQRAGDVEFEAHLRSARALHRRRAATRAR